MLAGLRSLIWYVQKFLKKLELDEVGVYAAQSAFFMLLSFFPFLMLLLTLLQYLPFTQQELASLTFQILPESVEEFIGPVIGEIFTNSSGTIIPITIITALWSASKGVMALIRGLDAAYDVQETRGYIRLRLLSIFDTFAFLLLIVVALVLLVFGDTLVSWVQQAFPFLSESALLLLSLRTVVGAAFVALFLVLIYTFIPNRRASLFAQLPGAVAGAFGWLGFSALYSFYIEHFANYSRLYGSLTAVVLLMLWMYICMYILLLGAELNVLLQRENVAHAVRRFRRQRRLLREQRALNRKTKRKKK